ncbi:MAG: Do family serine endopeptidase [Muribaculaceae bacterium]|nr:Do family serine endopeptidase [Muribaculaceae bacterium]
MKNILKTTLLSSSIAIACSLAVNAWASPQSDTQLTETSLQGENDRNFYNVSQRATPPTDFTHAAESTINGVVSIKSFATPRSYQYGNGNSFSDPFFDFFFGNPYRRRQQPQQQEREEQPLGLGSGVIISDDGYIVTNNHVIDGAEKLEITLNDNRTFNATVVGTDATTDLALIKIDADNLPVIPIGDSDALKVGEWVLAVGNPFGFTSTVTTGIVSAKARNISSITHGRAMGIESFIQTDAAVNPGNSGGALVNINGELVGINTAIYSQTGNYAGYSFAIPTSIVTKIITDIKQYGTVQRAVLGISFSELTPKQAKEKDITIVNDGLLVAGVSDRSAAKEAGLEEGDVIIAINGTETHNTAQLQEQMAKYRPGDKITVTYVRDNKKHTANVTLRNNQGNTKITKANDIMELGCAFSKVPDETLKQLEISYGVQVSGLTDGKFKNAGIKDGFIILEINNTRVTSRDDVEKIYNAIMKSQEHDKVMFIIGIYPTGKKVYYAVPLSE